MRHAMTVLAVLWLLYGGTALAANQDSQKLLNQYFAKKGDVLSAIFPPITGPEIGAALISAKPAEDGTRSAAQLVVARVAGRNDVRDVLVETLPAANGKPQYAFMLNGKHIMTYGSSEWRDNDGLAHARGDLRIRDLEAEGGPKVVYELKDVVDLTIPSGSVQYTDCLLWQPKPHFLNPGTALPVRNSYVHLSYNEEKKEYALFQHLQALPDAEKIDSANANNRALLYYRIGALAEAARLLERAYAYAESEQSKIAGNQQLVKGEIEELSRQLTRVEGRVIDRALLYFWQGEYRLCVGELAPRQREGLDELDCAMAGLAMAQEGRWPEVDNLTIDLERRQAAFLPDYIGQLVDIADLTGHPDIASTYLQALAAADVNHPAYAAWYAESLDRQGKTTEAEAALVQYLAKHPGGNENARPRLKLYELYWRRGNSAGCEQLAKDALAGPVTDLQAYAQLADFYDLAPARKDILTESTHIKAPDEPLNTFGIN